MPIVVARRGLSTRYVSDDQVKDAIVAETEPFRVFTFEINEAPAHAHATEPPVLRSSFSSRRKHPIDDDNVELIDVAATGGGPSILTSECSPAVAMTSSREVLVTPLKCHENIQHPRWSGLPGRHIPITILSCLKGAVRRAASISCSRSSKTRPSKI